MSQPGSGDGREGPSVLGLGEAGVATQDHSPGSVPKASGVTATAWPGEGKTLRRCQNLGCLWEGGVQEVGGA